MNKEEFENIINKIKDSVDETTGALISEDLLSLVSAYNTAIDTIAENSDMIDNLKNDKDELLKVNGRLFQKIGFEKEEKEEKEDEEELSVEDIIDEKGELI